MTYFSHIPLQTGIYNLLSADTTLGALISGVFDQVPEGTAYPFVTIGEHSIKDLSNLDKQGTEHQLALRIWSREGGRKQAGTIMERIVTLMHNNSLTVTGNSVLHVRFVSSNITLQEDGRTYLGTLNFRVLLTAN